MKGFINASYADKNGISELNFDYEHKKTEFKDEKAPIVFSMTVDSEATFNGLAKLVSSILNGTFFSSMLNDSAPTPMPTPEPNTGGDPS
jgi:hypothetical protein